MRVELEGIEVLDAGADVLLRAGAGEVWDRLVSMSVSRGLAGIECLSGIPGSVGGTPIQNVGAYGQEVADVIDSVDVFDRDSSRMVTLSSGECGFAYRSSRFKRDDAGRFIVCGVTLRLRAGTPTVTYPDVVAHLERGGVRKATVEDVRDAVLAVRAVKGMVVDALDSDTCSVGSFFMNPVLSRAGYERIAQAAGTQPPGYPTAGDGIKVPAAWLIERAGFQKGFVDGRAGISSKHPLAIVNRGGASARDIVRVAVRVKRGVAERFGVSLQTEPVFVGFESDADVEYLRTGN